MARLILVVLAILCGFLVLAGIDTGDLSALRVLALGLIFAAAAVVVP